MIVRNLVVMVAAALLLCGPLTAADEPKRTAYRLDADKSILAFVTYKGGALSGLLDNVHTHPERVEADIQVGAEVSDATFSLKIETGSLAVNEPDISERWYPVLRDLGIVEKPFEELSGYRRRKTLKTMLSEDQLDAENHPFITAVTTRIQPAGPESADNEYAIALDITIRDETVSVTWPATIERSDDSFVVRTHGPLKFSDFGIEPFSRLFGAVKYEDEFHVFAHVEAHVVKSDAR